MKNKRFLVIIAVLGLAGWGPFQQLAQSKPKSKNWIKKEMKAISSQATNLDPAVLERSLVAYQKARAQGLDDKQMLTIIDYSKPSTERRLWVIDLKNDKVLFNTWVSHGKNSGKTQATSFSNRPGSLKSSFGVFSTTSEAYTGHNGYSLRLKGLEPGINDNAYQRAIVIHGARYVSRDVVKDYGTLGRSWGCPAVNKELAKPIINSIKDGTIIVAYYPDQSWLRNSTYMAG